MHVTAPLNGSFSSMPLQYEIIHLLCAPQGYLAEVKRLDLPATAPKAKRYQWLWIEKDAVNLGKPLAL